MPPETKPVISSLTEMTCKNCLYSNKHWQEETVKCRLNLDSELDDFAKVSNSNFFCSHGRWLTGRFYSSDIKDELTVDDFDDCYYHIVRAEMFPDKITLSTEYKYRTDVLSKLTTLISELGWMPESGSLEKLAKDVQSTLKVMWEE